MADLVRTPKILVVDDDPKIRWVLRQGLEDDNYDVDEAEDGLEALQKFETFQPDLTLMDVKMPGMDGLEAMSKIREMNIKTPIIVLSAFPDSKIIVQAMKSGAEDFLIKPFDIEMVKMIIQKTLEREGMKEEIEKLKGELEISSAYGQFVGDSLPMREIKQQIEQVADSELNILIEGESGTGKEIVARLLHQRSERKRNPFIKVNCAALPEHLLESELFGYEKGAFTGAVNSKPGRFELADGGTIFLDEIGEMPLSLQAKLLQVLEHKEFFRVGGKKLITVDVRIISATNIDMQKNIDLSIFRSDLYFRLNDVTISLPPLRSRIDDLALLFEHFMLKYSKQYGKEPVPFSEAIETELSSYEWPGNVRELESFIKRMVVLGYENALRQLKGAGAFSVPKKVGAGADGQGDEPEENENSQPPDTYSLKVIAQKALSRAEKRAIRRAREKTKWNRKRAAELLEISYRSLWYKIKEYEI
jgi:DNA-binding NtrC family response regulator